MMCEYFSDSLNVIKAHRFNKDLPHECCMIDDDDDDDDDDDGMRIARADFTFDTWITEPREKTGSHRENVLFC